MATTDDKMSQITDKEILSELLELQNYLKTKTLTKHPLDEFNEIKDKLQRFVSYSVPQILEAKSDIKKN